MTFFPLPILVQNNCQFNSQGMHYFGVLLLQRFKGKLVQFCAEICRLFAILQSSKEVDRNLCKNLFFSKKYNDKELTYILVKCQLKAQQQKQARKVR